jgi:NAD(P)H-flavin reductase
MITPKAGLVIPDFETGNVLYLTGSTTILAGENAAALIPHSNLVVTIKVEALRLVQHGLPFRGKSIDQSPYNPPVRYLATERAVPALATRNVRAIMLTRELLTPSIARFRFKISDPRAIGGWKPGQYAALSFEDKLSGGYSHMRDDDPKSLNDDFTRTFTISAPPKGGGALDDEFEMTIRKVGVVTNFMFRQNLRAGLEIPLYGFGGDFFISQGVENIVPFVAGGIGITSLLGQLSILNVSRLRLFWANHASDLGLVEDTFRRTPELATSTSLFISGFTGTQSQLAILNPIEVSGVRVVKRRMSLLDLEESMSIADEWYICAGPALRTNLLQWLAGKEVVYEDFSY